MTRTEPDQQPAWAALLPQLRGFRLLPVSGPSGKVPIDPTTARPTGWDAGTYDTDAIARFTQLGICTGSGMHTGPGAAPGGAGLICFDVDGAAGVEFLQARGCDPFAGEALNSWAIVRREDPNRLKILFRLPPAKAEQLGAFRRMRPLRDPVRDAAGVVIRKGEGIEAYCGVGQIVVLGLHRESGGQYLWRGNPQALLDLPPSWEALIDEITPSGATTRRSGSACGRGDWFRLRRCPICGRDERPVCQQHRDGNTVRCFHGQTFHPPIGLRPGEVIDGDWAYCTDQEVGWGSFGIFVRHQPRHQQTTPARPSRRHGRSRHQRYLRRA